jgi:ribonuclease P protein component
MLSKRSRLPREEFRAGRYVAITTPYFSLKARPNDGKHSRIGVIVSTAVDKRATRRNFLKRQAKAALLSIPDAPYDFLAIIFPKVNTLKKNQLRMVLLETAERLMYKLK